MTNDELLILGRVVCKCWDDSEYKSKLIADPRTVLVEAGCFIRDDVVVTVKEGETGLPHSISEKEIIFPLPAKPENQDDFDKELSEEQINTLTTEQLGEADLGQVVGGARFMRPTFRRHFNVGNWLSTNRTHRKHHYTECAW